MSRAGMNIRLVGALAVALAAATACGGGDSSEPGPLDQLAAAKEAVGNARNAAGAYKEMGNALAEMAADSNVTVDPVDFRSLRDLLPASLAGLPRTEATGEKTGAMGMTISKAEAHYRADGDDGSSESPALDVTITDMGALRGMGMLSLAAWTMAEVDRETADGFERTSKFEGHPAYEKFSNSESYRNGNIQVVVAKRFLVEVEGTNLDFDRIRSALEAIPVKQLEGMKEQGVTRGG